jgi:putative glutathione S-transferase
MDQIRTHYYRTHPMINPSGLVALQPEGDFRAPVGRPQAAGAGHLRRRAAKPAGPGRKTISP